MNDETAQSMGPVMKASATGRRLNRRRAGLEFEPVPAFNLFRQVRAVDVVCAVPEDRQVPSFIRGSGWSFAGKTGTGTRRMPGFDVVAARDAADRLGFYLFQTWGSVVTQDSSRSRSRTG